MEPSPPPSPKAQERKDTGDANQKKATKPKKPKVKRLGTAEIAERIDTAELGRVLEGIEQKYKADEGIQLEIFADHFISLFKDADIPFNKIVLDMPHSKVSPPISVHATRCRQQAPLQALYPYLVGCYALAGAYCNTQLQPNTC